MAALEPNANKSEIARRYGIRRQRIYQPVDGAMIDPRGKPRDAEKEVVFKKHLVELVG